MLEKINHYSLNNPASIYDEEALTTLELVARLTSLYNSIVGAINDQGESIEKLNENMVKTVEKWLSDHPEITTSLQDGEITVEKLNESLKWMSVKDYIIPQMYGAVGDGTKDDTTAIINAIESIKNNPGKTNVLTFPAGKYVISETIRVPSYVKLRAGGLVELEYTGTGNLINIYYDENTPDFGNKQDHARTPIIAGSFLFTGNDANKGYGVYIEPYDSGNKQISRFSIEDVRIRDFKYAIGYPAIHWYLTLTSNVSTELCEYGVHIYTTTFTPYDYGENNRFNDCTFAGHKVAILNDCNTGNVIFNNCSFDFNTIIFSGTGSTVRYWLNNCHLENYQTTDNLIYWIVGSAFDSYSLIHLNECVIVGSPYQPLFTIGSYNLRGKIMFTTPGVNVPAKTMFLGRFDNMLEMQSDVLPYMPCPNANVDGNGYFADMEKGTIINTAIGHLSTTLGSHTFITCGCRASIVNDGNDVTGKALQLEWTDANSSYFAVDNTMYVHGGRFYKIVPIVKGVNNENTIKIYMYRDDTLLGEKTVYTNSIGYSADYVAPMQTPRFFVPAGCNKIKTRVNIVNRTDATKLTHLMGVCVIPC